MPSPIESRAEHPARPVELVLVLDSGAVTRLSERSRAAAALILALHDEGLWPPLVPSVVLVECLQGHAGRDASENKFLKTCDVAEEVSEHVARRAAFLRRRARRGSAVDALVVASAEPDGTVLTSDPRDLEALAAHAERVRIERI
jgi:predicted nucleic acid-binding protein